jgi:hypothetical protein
MLGWRMFESFDERCLWVSNRYAALAEKYGSAWKLSQLKQFDYILRKFIEQKIRNGKLLQRASDWFNSAEYIDNLESLLYEPRLEIGSLKYHDVYYLYFKPTLDAIRLDLASRERFGKAWSGNT